MTDQLLFTPLQAANALCIGRSKVYELMQSGELESIHIGSCRRVPADALTALIERLGPARVHAQGRFSARHQG
jgi:excisionase family DNA binding protein